MDDHPLTPQRTGDDESLERTLRPQSFGEFVGQEKLVENLRIYLTAAGKRGEPLEHVLFCGLPGLGKTTLAQIIARGTSGTLRITSGPALDRARDLVGILTQLERGDLLFIDEVHRMNRAVEEYLYSAMEDFAIDIVLDQGANARSVRLDLPRFTLIAATTREGLLTKPFRGRFGILERLEPYGTADLVRILERTASLLGVESDPSALERIASRSRGTPRVANRLLRRVRDLVQAEEGDRVTEEAAERGLGMQGVDPAGLDAVDRRILEALVVHDGAAVGLKTLAVSVGEEERTIEEVYEPFLIREGYVRKTPRGRIPTPRAFEHLGRAVPTVGESPELFG